MTAPALVIEETVEGLELHPKKREFVELYVSDPDIGGNATRCFLKVHPHLNPADSREYGYASVKASEWLKDAEVDEYRKALIGKATRKVKGRISQAAERAATILLSVMEGHITSRLQFDAAVRVLELNGITPVQRSEVDVGERIDQLIRDLAARRTNRFARTPGNVEFAAIPATTGEPT